MLADFLDPCPTCAGRGHLGFHDDGVGPVIARGCDDCIGGLVPSETDIEAVAETLHREALCGPHYFAACHRQTVFTDQARAAVTTLIERWSRNER